MKEKPNQKNQAVALQYDHQTAAPRVIAKGRNELADKIIALAKEHHIPLHHDPDLTALLGQLDLGEEIPRNLYLAVAQVIAFVYRIKNK